MLFVRLFFALFAALFASLFVGKTTFPENGGMYMERPFLAFLLFMVIVFIFVLNIREPQ